MDKLQINAIKTNTGFYLTDKQLAGRYSYDMTAITRYLINGMKPEKSYDPAWSWVSGSEIVNVQKENEQVKINERFELIDPRLQSENIPLVIKKEDALVVPGSNEDDDEEYGTWKSKISHLRSLYVEKHEYSEPELVNVEFTVDVILTLDIDKIIEPEKMFYNGEFNRYADDNKPGYPLMKADVHHPLLAKIIYPKFVLQFTESKYTSKQVYDILRKYIKENINPKVAKITSDYNFCFTVEKVINLAQPYSWDKEILTTRGKSYHPKKLEKRYTSNRSVKVFEMTSAEDNYKGYTPIPELIAGTEAELVEKMKNLCENIIADINIPLRDCPHCNGSGVILEDSK